MRSSAAQMPVGELKQRGVALLRAARLLPAAELARCAMESAKARRDNAAFCAQSPAFAAPPLDLMHDAYGHAFYRTYDETGRADAAIMAALILKHHPVPRTVLEWGCGPARVLRHLPERLPNAAIYGSDYNQRSIAWCRTALPALHFACNGAEPPLPFNERFDAIYGISVMTHLSLSQQRAWADELRRRLSPNGVLILTTHGEACAGGLLPGERAKFEAEGVVIRGNVARGGRCFAAYHHPDYVRTELLRGFEIVDHIGENPAAHASQDIWVAKRGKAQ